MSKTIIVAGYGPGISSAVAERFGREGFQVALVARNQQKLDAAVSALAEKGIKAKAFATDLQDPSKARAMVVKVRDTMGDVTAIHWNAAGSTAGDLLTADDAAIRAALDIGVTSLIATVQAALPYLTASKESAVLITNGGLAFAEPKIDAMAVQWGSMGLAMVNATKHKLVGLLAEKLKGQVYVGEVIVLGIVKGTAFDRGQGGLDPKTIGGKFWDLYAARKDVVAQVG